MKAFEVLEYRLKRYKRAKHLRIAVKPGGVVVVSVPWRTPQYVAAEFVQKHAAWLKEARKKMLQVAPAAHKGDAAEYAQYKKEALSLFSQRLEELNRFYHFSYKRVSVRNQQTRWGSCSRSGTLSFSYRILFLPPAVRDYVFVHELCHIAHMNHSVKFWALVAKTCPDYKQLRRRLRESVWPAGKSSVG